MDKPYLSSAGNKARSLKEKRASVYPKHDNTTEDLSGVKSAPPVPVEGWPAPPRKQREEPRPVPPKE